MASYDMDSQALQKAILDGTLPDHVALAELKWRLKLHVDSDNNSPLYDSIRRLLRDAMHMAMDAVAEGKPVVTVLKDMLLDLGRLKMQASAEHDLNVVTEGTKKEREDVLPSVPSRGFQVKAKSIDSEPNTTHPFLAAVPKSTSKAKQASPPQKGKHASSAQKGKHNTPTPSRLRSRSRSVSPSGGFGSLTPFFNKNALAVRKPDPPASNFAPALATSSPSSSLLPETPAANSEAANPPEVSKNKRRPRKKPISKPTVSDSDASDELSSPRASEGLTPSNNVSNLSEGGKSFAVDTSMPTKAAKSTLKRTRDTANGQVGDSSEYVDISEGISGFQWRNPDGSRINKPHGREIMVNGHIRPALIVKCYVSPDRLRAVMEGMEPQHKKRKSSTESKTKEVNKAAAGDAVHQRRDATLHSTPKLTFEQAKPLPESQTTSVPKPSQPNAIIEATNILLSRNFPNAAPSPSVSSLLPDIDKTENSESSPNTITSTSLIPFKPTVTPTPPTLPPFPDTTARRFPLWFKGLLIAVENIISAHEANPTANMLEILAEEDLAKPTIPGDDRDRLPVLAGSAWVFATIRAQIAGKIVECPAVLSAGGEQKTSPGDAMDVDVDIAIVPTDTAKKVYYKGPGRAWKKTEEDNDPDFLSQQKNVPQVAERRSERKAARAAAEAWREMMVLFEAFRRHVRSEYERCTRELGVVPEREGMPMWLVEE